MVVVAPKSPDAVCSTHTIQPYGSPTACRAYHACLGKDCPHQPHVDDSSYTPPATATGVAIAVAVFAILAVLLVLTQHDWHTQVLGGLGMLWLMFASAMQSPTLKEWNAKHNTLVAWAFCGPIVVVAAVVTVGWAASALGHLF